MPELDEFDEFYRAYYGHVATLVGALLGNRADAEDIAQEAFSRALSRWRSLRDEYDAPLAWVRRVAVNLAVDAQRRAFRVRRLLLRLPVQTEPPEVPHKQPLAETPVGAALLRVPIRQREMLVLRYVADLSVEAIARECNIPLGTVKDRLAAGRRRLEAELLKAEAMHDGR